MEQTTLEKQETKPQPEPSNPPSSAKPVNAEPLPPSAALKRAEDEIRASIEAFKARKAQAEERLKAQLQSQSQSQPQQPNAQIQKDVPANVSQISATTEPDPEDDSDLPEELRNKSKESKFNFRKAVQERAEKLAEEKLNKLKSEKEKEIEEVRLALQQREEELKKAQEYLKQQDGHLKLFLVEKSEEYLQAEQGCIQAKEKIVQLANRLNISEKDALSLLTRDIVEMAIAKKNIKKTYGEDGETFVEIAQEYAKEYMNHHHTKEQLVARSEQEAKRIMEERAQKQAVIRLRQETERLQTEKTVAQYISEITFDAAFRAKEGVDFTPEELSQEVFKSLREINSRQDEKERLELMAEQVALAKALEKQNAKLIAELSKVRKMLSTAGIKYADPGQISSNSRADTKEKYQSTRPSIAEINAAIESQVSRQIRIK